TTAPTAGTESPPPDRPTLVGPPPVLTLYQEHTAPLPSPPPASKPKPDRSKPFSIKSETTRAAPPSEKDDAQATRAAPAAPDHTVPASADRVELPAPTPAAAPEPGTTRYTVQVGAFAQREQAEAIRARPAAAGHDGFVADLDAPAATRFRVRIGSYATRDEARRAAERLTATERLSTYVTLR